MVMEEEKTAMEQMLLAILHSLENWNWKTSRCNQYQWSFKKRKQPRKQKNDFSTNKDF